MDRQANYDELLKSIQSTRQGLLNIYYRIVSKEQFSDPTGMKGACWTKVLSYLQLQDLISFSQCHPFFAATVDQFVCSGNPVTIDEALDRNITIDNANFALLRIGMSAKNLIVSGVDRKREIWLCLFFQHVTHLTWENMDRMPLADGFLLRNVTHLKISNCTCDDESFYYWITNLFGLFSTIHFDRLCLSNNLCYGQSAWFPVVQHLIVENSNIAFYNYSVVGLESLQIITSKVSRLFRFAATDCAMATDSESYADVLLQKYKWDHKWDQLEDGSALRDLHSNIAPSKIDNILKWTQLEHVNIHCKWYHAEQLRTHFQSLASIKSCVVTCSAPSPGSDLWDSLNEDCLRMIMSYLTEDDLHNLLIADPRFIALHPAVRIDTICVKLHPPETSAEFYQRMATQIDGLEISGLTETDFYKVIVHFPNITSLELQALRLRDLKRISTIPLVSELILDNCEIKAKFWQPLYRHLNPSLRKLRLINIEPRNMLDLTDIQDFYIYCEGCGSVSCLRKFLKRNRMLTNLHVELYELPNASLFLFLASVNADSLRYLNTTFSDDDESAKILVQHINRFRNLETFICKSFLDKDALTTITLTELTVLEMCIVPENIVLDIVQMFQTLKRLVVFIETEMSRSLHDRLEKCLSCLGKKVTYRHKKEYGVNEYTFCISPYFMG